MIFVTRVFCFTYWLIGIGVLVWLYYTNKYKKENVWHLAGLIVNAVGFVFTLLCVIIYRYYKELQPIHMKNRQNLHYCMLQNFLLPENEEYITKLNSLYLYDDKGHDNYEDFLKEMFDTKV